MTAVVGRISSSSIHHRTVTDFGRLQTDLANLQNQISSGIKSNTFAGLTGQVEQFVGLETKISKLDNYMNNNAEVMSRIQSTRQSLSNTIDIVDDAKNLLVLRRNDALKDDLAFVQQMKALRESISNQLNQNVNGRYLFGGTRTDQPPIKEVIPPLSVENTPDAGYYQGSTEDIYVRPMDGYTFAYNIRADEQAFQDVYAAIQIAIEGHEQDDDTKIALAMDTITKGISGVTELQTRADATIVDLQNINDRHEAAKLYFKGVAEEISQTDVLAASTEAALAQTMLTATFQTFARITSLKLSDYLR